MTILPDDIQAVQIQEDRTPAVVTLPFASQEKVQKLPPDEVLIRVRAVGLAPTDWKHAFTEWGTPGAISGCDAAGNVLAVGSAVTHVKVGDRVGAFNYGGSWQKDNGAFAEYARFIAATCIVLPPDMTYEEGASLPGAHFTAVQVLYMRLGLPKPLTSEAAAFKKKDEKILIWGASTSVGHHAIQLAALSGLEVYATASLSAHEEVKALGASHVFDYRDQDAARKIQKAAGEEGIVYAIDCVCEKGSTDVIIDAMSSVRGGKVITLLFVPEPTQNRRADVKVEFTLAYTILGYDIEFAHFLKVSAKPEDKAYLLEYCGRDISRVLEGWKAGEGAPTFKPQRLREIGGGIEGIARGLKVMQEGKYGREKLVCKIA
ncbi:GroES-like protein [Peniophora sp. CONT]|nr:GroES-like protein [Peniophora sp. CONT]